MEYIYNVWIFSEIDGLLDLNDNLSSNIVLNVVS